MKAIDLARALLATPSATVEISCHESIADVYSDAQNLEPMENLTGVLTRHFSVTAIDNTDPEFFYVFLKLEETAF